MPAIPAELKLCGVRGVGTEVEVGVWIARSSDAGTLLTARQIKVLSSIDHVTTGPGWCDSGPGIHTTRLPFRSLKMQPNSRHSLHS